MDKGICTFSSGEFFDGLHTILAGPVRLGYVDIQGQEALFAIVGPVVWVSEISFIDHQPRSYNAICIQPSKVLKISEANLLKLVQKHLKFWRHLAAMTNQKNPIYF